MSQSRQDKETVQNPISETQLKEEDVKAALWKRAEDSLQESTGENLLHYSYDKQKSRNTCAKYSFLNLSGQQEDEWFICHAASKHHV